MKSARCLGIFTAAHRPPLPPDTLLIGGDGLPFNRAANLLGQEFDTLWIDARHGINLEAIAIAAGTIKAGGQLILHFPNWERAAHCPDADSLRWSGSPEPIATPNFIAHLQKCVKKYRFPVIHHADALQPLSQRAVDFSHASTPHTTTAEAVDVHRKTTQRAVNFFHVSAPHAVAAEAADFHTKTTQSAVDFSGVFANESKVRGAAVVPTAEQAWVIGQMRQSSAALLLLTAKRGRGKSALAGWLANGLSGKIYLTAANKNAVRILRCHSCADIEFIAPDELAERLRRSPDIFRSAWLFVDEAAMLPLPWLHLFSRHFRRVLFITTLHGYEGTGQGFTLKFRQKIDRTLAEFSLTTPLRWADNDPLERFVEDLLLLNAQSFLPTTAPNPRAGVRCRACSQATVARSPQAFYALLSHAHYRTTPLDLRRLFDADGQRFFYAEQGNQLIGGVWALVEGGMRDEALIADIQRGIRRPRGNLVPQMLCFYANFPQACRLTSLRLSRIALLPPWQRQGIGSQLIDLIKKNTQTDWLSVSFGYTAELAAFWVKNGFQIVHLGEHRDAASGAYTAVALQGLSATGQGWAQQVKKAFQRDIGLSFHPLNRHFFSTDTDWTLTERDWTSLRHFAEFHRTLAATVPAIRRLLVAVGESALPLAAAYCRTKTFADSHKNGVQSLRQEISRAIRQQTHTIQELYDDPHSQTTLV